MLRRLLIWIMLFALPLQSYAAVAMIYCAPSHHNVAVATSEMHHHADMHGMSMSDHHDDTGTHHAGHKSTDKCSACSACCLGVVASTSINLSTFPPIGSPVLVSHPVTALSSVILDGLQRPPRTTLA